MPGAEKSDIIALALPDGRGSEAAAPRPSPLALTGILLAGFALRLPLLDRFPFHQDEAIYGYWARYARHVDPLFLRVWPDKPPLYLWLLGGTFDLLGATPTAARLLNIALSTLTIAVVAALAQTWWGARAGILAALFLALNPFAISFAPTAFTDPLLVLAGMTALLAIVRRRPFWAGIWLGVAIMTKQQGVLFVPLVAAFSLYAPRTPGDLLHRTAALLAGLLLIVAPILAWDSLRWAVAPSPWDLGARNAAGFALAAPALWPVRAQGWLELSSYLLGETWLWLAALGLLLAFGLAWRKWRSRVHWQPAAGLALWGVTLLALHIVTTVQVWDRYLLPLAPIVALLLAFTVETVLTVGVVSKPHISANLERVVWKPHLLAMLLVLALAWPAFAAAQGRLPIGGDHGAYSGLDEVAAWLTARTDAAPVVYQRNLGWHFQFYFFDALQAGRADLRWYPSAVALADNAAKTPHRPRYLVVADWSPVRDLPVQLATRRLAAAERLRAGHFTVYEITETALPPAAWRVCERGARGEGRGAALAEADGTGTFAGFAKLAAPAAQLSTCPVEDQP
jgi:4-amino-4-deoxy-L-arabinose transferase-like glycosyltransferase